MASELKEVRYEAVASDPTAVWRIATVANHKADMVQQQRDDFQKSFNRLKESMNRVEASWQRMIEDLRQINPSSTQGVHLHGTPEGNHISLPTGYSVVATGWDEDPLPHAFVVPPALNNLNPTSDPDLARQWHLNPREYLSQPQFKYPARQWNSIPSNDRAPSFYKSLAKGHILDSPEFVGGEPLVGAVIQKKETTMKSSTPGACKYCGYKGFCGHKYKHDLQELAVVPINSTLIHEVKFVSTVKDLESAYALAMNDTGNLLVSGGIEQVVSVWDPGTGSKNMKWQSSLIRVGGRLTFDVVSAAGKLFHSESGSYSQVDLNSAGVPLLEIVSETDMRTRIETAEPRADAKLTINGVMGNLAAYLINERLSIDGIKLTPLKPFELIASIKNGTIRGKIGKEILDELIAKGRTVSSMMEEKDLVQNADPAAIEVIGQHKSHYCYFIRLMLEYSKFSSLDSDKPFACKLNNPKHRDTYKQVYVHILNYAADLWEELPKFSMQIVGLFWIFPPWPDLSFCEVCWRDMGLENGAGAESRRNAYSIVAGQSKNQLQQTRYKQLNDDIVLKEETALKSLIPVKFNLYWSIIVICYPGEVKTFEDGVPESVCAIWGTQQLTMSICLNDSGEKVVPASGCILDTGSVSMVAAQNLPKLGVCPPDKDSVFCLSSQEEKTEPPITGSDNQFDMCAGLVGKVERNVPEDDHRSPAGITDKIGDDVGDIAEMGSDLFGSSEEFSCAALVVVSISSIGVNRCFTGMCYPLLASSIGIIVCLIATILATDFLEIKVEKENEPALQKQLIIPTALMMVGMAMFSWVALPDVADPCGNGVTTNVIISLVLGYKLVNIPIFAIAVSIYVSISMTAMYGIAVAVLDMLSTIAIGLAIDAYGSNSDNTGGLAERVGMSHRIPENAIGGIYGVLIPMIGHMFEEVQRPGTPLYKIKTLMKCVMQLWLPVSQALLEMTISHFPSPPKTQKHCVGNLYEGPLVDIYAIAIRKCDSEGPLMLYVSKLIPASDKGRLFAFGHVYSWRVATGMKILIMGHNYVPGQSKDLYVMSVQLTVIWLGRKLKSVENDPCGNTVTVMGPDQFITKNTTLPNEKEVDACQMKSMKLYVSFAVHVAVQYKGLLKKFLWMRLILPRNISRIVCPDYQILGSRSILEDKYAVEEEEMSEPSILKQLEKG